MSQDGLHLSWLELKTPCNVVAMVGGHHSMDHDFLYMIVCYSSEKPRHADTRHTLPSMSATLSTLVPLLQTLVSDPESVIRQHLAFQLLPMSVVCMLEDIGPFQTSVETVLQRSHKKRYNETGYWAVCTTILGYLNTFITDVDVDVRRSASEALAGMALLLRPPEVASHIVRIPLAMISVPPKKATEALQEEYRITACNLLAELAGAAEAGKLDKSIIQTYVLPTILLLAKDPSFRIRRAAVQAMPRVVGGTSLETAKKDILPMFLGLSKDDMYRVRKSTGECLVDMSRSLMLLAPKRIKELRRTTLIPICLRLLQDANKFVRHGMMQFLGPFIASFYPYGSSLDDILPGGTSFESFVFENSGIGAQFFPHASSMVSRLNSSVNVTSSSPTPTPATLNAPEIMVSQLEKLQRALPTFLSSNRLSNLSLTAVVKHRREHPPDEQDLQAIKEQLLKHFCSLSTISTGEDNTDAEMRVYCAYSYPAVVLLLGKDNWEGELKECFLTLINPSHNKAETDDVVVPPLPVKRCLASSLHTVAHILGTDLAVSDVLPIFRQHFLSDTDDSVRLNVIRNFPFFLALLPMNLRIEMLATWSETMKGEDMLGAHKRSVTNPMLLNWRQRDFLARSLPDMLGLANATNIKEYLWPILQMLVLDTVCLVREDAEWSIPLLLRAYCTDNPNTMQMSLVDKKWCSSSCNEVIVWLRETILGIKIKPDDSCTRKSNFGQRQLYCRIVASVGLTLRFGDLSDEEQFMPMSGYSPYQKLSTPERQHLRRLLVQDLLPLALEMKDDRVTNVRLTLMKTLQLMPQDIKELAAVSDVLKQLENEVDTWESFNSGIENQQPKQLAPSKELATEQQGNIRDRIAAYERLAANDTDDPFRDDPFRHAV